MSSPQGFTSGDDLAFIRRRVGIVSGVVAGIAFVALTGGVLQATVGPLAGQPINASLYYATASVLVFGGSGRGLLRAAAQAPTGFTYLLVLRAALVPTTARQTFWLSLSIGVSLVILTWFKYSANEAFLATAPAIRRPAISTFWIALWWSFTTAVCTVISRIVYGLRREVRAAERNPCRRDSSARRRPRPRSSRRTRSSSTTSVCRTTACSFT